MEFNRVRVFADETALARAVAAAIRVVAPDAVARRGRCAVALSGGSTPRTLYRELAAHHRSTIPWAHVDVFWGDERFVPATDPQSNYRMAKAELLDHVPCPAANVHAISTDLETPEAAAGAYTSTLREYFGDGFPRFDLLLLGIGMDGHTASLFPRSPALEINDAPVTATRAPDNSPRITLTMPVLLAAHTTFVLAAGAGKASAMARALAPETPIADCPAAALRQSAGTVTWWIDRRAAGGLEGTEPSSHGVHGTAEA
jgi:6-phosphogluconolactonase